MRAIVEPLADSPSSKSKGTVSAQPGEITVTVDNESDTRLTVISIEGDSRPGLLSALAGAFRSLALDVEKANIDGSDGRVSNKFSVKQADGSKVRDAEVITNVKRTLEAVLKVRPGSEPGITKRPNLLMTAGIGLTQRDEKKELLYGLMDTYIKNDVLSIEESIVNHVEYTMARSRYKFDDQEAYMATAYSLRDRLIESWNDTQAYFKEQDVKRVYYLSMEFLMGRSLTNALYNLQISGPYSEALQEMGYDLETLVEQERDAALGNGGLGRLAACFLDSMATLDLPAWGYGIRYQYGMFRQSIVDGFQHEQPDYWLNFGNPWEIERLNVAYPIKYYGHVSVQEDEGRQLFKWNPGETVTAVAYDNPIPGYGTNNTINLRLWAAKPDTEFDLEAFNTGDYVQAILSKQRAETLSSVLYPDDRTFEGKELRLKQQHFFVSATIQDVIRRYKEAHTTFDAFPDKVAFQLNDTHPTVGVAELMRLLMDENDMGWTQAWELTCKVFAFTNHTVLPEALEKWPVSLMEKLLPRHMQIIYDINWRFLQQMRARLGDNWERISRMSIIEEGYGGEKFVRMAYLAIVASHSVNGVAAIHSEIIKTTIFKDFAELWPEKFQNKTNGVTPRRWLAFCNPPMRELLTRTLGGDGWIRNFELVQGVREKADDPAFQREWQKMKLTAKVRALAKISAVTGVKLPENALLDVQVKRIHEYKRQLMNVLSIIHRYSQIKEMTPAERAQVVPRVCVIGGKAAPGYEMAKRIIKLVNAVGEKINVDPDVGDLLKVVFLPDYNVSLAEVIIPGTEVSQHISTAGTEASGTSNMKFAMNGALIIGTLDGANIEISEEIGAENMFIFGAVNKDVARLRQDRENFQPDPRFEAALNMIRKGEFGWEGYFDQLIESLSGSSDYYLLANDFPSYLETQARVDETYRDQAKWTRMSIMSTGGSSFFSSDRTIGEYARDIWGVEACAVPADL